MKKKLKKKRKLDKKFNLEDLKIMPLHTFKQL